MFDGAAFWLIGTGHRNLAATPDVFRYWFFGATQGRLMTAINQRTEVEIDMSNQTETGHVTGTKDKTYNLLWFTERCLNNALRLETYISDAERDGDNEVAELFRKAKADSQKGAEQAKSLLAQRLK